MTKDNKTFIFYGRYFRKNRKVGSGIYPALLVILLVTVSTSFATADNARKDKTSKANEIKAGAGCSQKITLF